MSDDLSMPHTPVPARDEHDEKQHGGEMTAILWCLLAGVFVLAALFVYASCFPVFVR